MKKFVPLVLMGLLIGTPVLAHESDFHVSDQTAPAVGKSAAAEFSKKDSGLSFGKLPSSWADVPLKNATIFKKLPEVYIIAVKNDKENKTLYVLLSSEGEVYDANFTGQFKDVK